LFPLLWALPYAESKSPDGYIIASFRNPKYHWHTGFDSCVKASQNTVEYLKKRIDKEWDSEVKARYLKNLEYEEDYLNNITEMLAKNDHLCEEIKEQLIQENAKNNYTSKH
jgi:predicted ribosome quality control (RQC) complex YloA/Tae2 family protein